MSTQPAPNRAHARQRLDAAWRAVDHLPADLRHIQVDFANLSEEPTQEERAALEATVNRALGHFAEGADALLAIRGWLRVAPSDQPEGSVTP